MNDNWLPCERRDKIMYFYRSGTRRGQSTIEREYQ